MTVLVQSALNRPAEVVQGERPVRLLLHELLEPVETEPTDAFAGQNFLDDLERQKISELVQKYVSTDGRNFLFFRKEQSFF